MSIGILSGGAPVATTNQTVWAMGDYALMPSR